ncbi:LacI family DNA-binding transcriptional regulator [Timonella senegalensis]|uniref:LacI family DNA-binding transcriptional regulator n=1 Tax=Timonella senegalensis TaxID=1465825 RepID=UPI002FDEBAD7
MSATKPTLAHVAARAGVSISTASLAFSESGPIASATRERVLAAAEELGYRGPSALGRQLRSGRTGIVGVVFGDALRRTFRDPVSISVLDGVTRTLGERGLGVLLMPGGTHYDSPDGVNPLLETAAVDAAIMLWGGHSSDPVYKILHERGIPVTICEGAEVEGSPTVSVRDREGSRAITQHLLDSGHTRIAVATLPLGGGFGPGLVSDYDIDAPDLPYWYPSHRRLRGVYDAGVTPVAIWSTQGSLVEEGQIAATNLLNPANYVDASQVPTAIVAQSDLLAAGVVQGARQLGLRVPEDVSVVGFDGVDLPWLGDDKLTTVDQPLAIKGEILAEVTIDLINGNVGAPIVLDTAVVNGTTSGPAPRR